MSSHATGNAKKCPMCQQPMEEEESLLDPCNDGSMSVLYRCTNCTFASLIQQKKPQMYRQPGDTFGYCLAAAILLLVIVGVVAYWQNISAWVQ